MLQHLRTPDAEKIREATVKLQERVDELETENNVLMKQVEKNRAVAQQIENRVSRATKTGCLAVSQMDKTDGCMQKIFEILNHH